MRKCAILALIACSSQDLHSTNAFSTTSFVRPTTRTLTSSPTTNLQMSDVAFQDVTQQSPTLINMPNNKNDDVEKEREIPNLGTLAKMLPRESFDIDTKTSLFYFGLDLVACIASLGFLDVVVTSDLYHSLPIAAQALMVAPLQILSGFAMWCMWCIGHDAGHGTVSKKNWINHLVGEISHSIFCLTPFVPWKKSHLKHHLNHNHLTRDYSHQWFIREEKDELPKVFQWSYLTRNVQLPILYLVYLLAGVPDGGHVFFYGKMWEGEPMKEKLRGAASVAVSMTTALSLWMTMGTADFAVVCFAPWLVLSFWLFMVTYLQHHSDDGVLYTDDTWSFTKGAFETVDRDYGKWINRMSHHMMDGHVVHHLFFTKVPHYRLEEATVALKQGLADIGQSDLHKEIDTPDFVQEIVRQFDDNWFFIDEKQVKR
jgi:omega-3 fatty acid desaturase (delta-15 desaturase)